MTQNDSPVNFINPSQVFGDRAPTGFEPPPPNVIPFRPHPSSQDWDDSVWTGTSSPTDMPLMSAISGAEILATKPHERQWLVPDLIPCGQVTLLSGNGGVGKSLLALQLGMAATSDTPWFGAVACTPTVGNCKDPRRGALVIACEDDFDELARRVHDIAKARALSQERLGWLRVVPMAGKDARLVTVDRQGNQTPTDFWEQIEHRVRLTRPRLVVLDTASHLFSGNENVRSEVTQFVQMLGGLAQDSGCAILLLSHPSVTGMATGTGLSGSTGWNNSVRSRLYMRTDPDDPDLRVLEQMKANYSASGASWRLAWRDGCFIAVDSATGPSDSEKRADDSALACVVALNSQGRRVAPSRFGATAEGLPQAAGLKRRALNAAIERLISCEKVRVVTLTENWKQVQNLIVA
jgi:AAA domain